MQYKATWLNSQGNVAPYGNPPLDSYTDSIAPTQPAASSGAALTFTPNIAGYWAVSASCGVTVTDTQTNQYWSGSATAGPKYLTSYILDISYGGNVVTNQTQDVSVGEEIPVTAVYGPSDMTLQWNVAGSIIANYAPKAGQTFQQSAAITPVNSTALTQPTLTYYWMDTDSGQAANEKVGLTGTLPVGKSPPPVNTTFNVYRPVPSFSTQYLGAVVLDSNDKDLPGLRLHDGDEGGVNNDPGIEFYFEIPSSQFGDTANLFTVQICDRLTVTTDQYDKDTGTTFTFEYTIPNDTVPAPVLDTSFTYWSNYPQDIAGGEIFDEWCYDAPNYPVDPPLAGSGFGAGNWATYNVIISEIFTHNLLFVPIAPAGFGTNYAPLSQITWGWSAEADNPGNGGFSLANPSQVPSIWPRGADLPRLPEWNMTAQPSWNNPQWFVAP